MIKIKSILCVVILFCSTSVFSQNLHIIDIQTAPLKEKPKSKPIPRKERFEKFGINDLGTSDFKVFAEKKILQVGDSVRIKFIFNPQKVKHLAVENGGPVIPYKDLRKGEWIVTVKPEKTTNIRTAITVRWDEFNREWTQYSNQIFIVLEPDEYKEVIAKYDELQNKGDARGVEKLLESLAGEEVMKTIRDR